MRRTRLGLLLGLFPLLAAGCFQSTEPPLGGTGDGLDDFTGNLDPATGSFVLKSLDVPVADGTPVRVDLIGRFLRTPVAAGQIAVGVRVRNADRRSLYAPAEIVVGNFHPPSVSIVPESADWITCLRDSAGDSTNAIPGGCLYGFVYSDLLGDDGILSPGEVSGEKMWLFYDPENVAFSFAAHARFGMAPDRARIMGMFFGDANRNGIRDGDEGPFGGGAVYVTGPGYQDRYIQVGPDATYTVFVSEPGIYTLRAVPPPTFGLVPVEFTTPNPLEVLINPGGDGGLRSFLHADFGLANAVPPPAVPPVLFAASADSLTLDGYALLRVGLDGHVLKLRVGYSGCSPDHPFQLYAVGGIFESVFPQMRLLLSHDDRGELCDAYFERDLAYDLTPILEKTGGGAMVRLLFEDSTGEVHTFDLNP